MKHNYTLDFFIKKLDNYQLLGEGVLGKVYKLNESTCVKINNNFENNQREINLYKKFSEASLFPKMYSCGKNYIVMELIKGKDLEGHLKNGNNLNRVWLESLVDMFLQGLKLGLTLNPRLRHIYLTKDNKIRLVDLEDIVGFARTPPTSFFRNLYAYGQKKVFLDYVKKHKKSLYDTWTVKKSV